MGGFIIDFSNSAIASELIIGVLAQKCNVRCLQSMHTQGLGSRLGLRSLRNLKSVLRMRYRMYMIMFPSTHISS